MPENTFIKITNKDIYDKIEKMCEKMDSIEEHVIQTNGKVKLNTLRSKIALVLAAAGFAIITGVNVVSLF